MLGIILRDILNKRGIAEENQIHCREAITWLFKAQDATGSDGVSALYHLFLGWWPPYPEVTGYIIPTMFDYAKFCETEISAECRVRAIRMADWLISIQDSNGAFRGLSAPSGFKFFIPRLLGRVKETVKPLIFDTAQALLGILRAYEETGDAKYLTACLKAGEWLVENQDKDGKWSRFAYNGIPHTYYTYAALPLIRLSKIAGVKQFETAGRRNLDWAMEKQNQRGWFEDTSFMPDEAPLTHNIAYTMQGFLESGILLGDATYVGVAEKAAEALLKVYSVRGVKSPVARSHGQLLPATFNATWRGANKYSCLTGNAQIALIWAKLYLVNGDARFLNGAIQMNEVSKQLQDRKSKNNGIKGGVKGSHPIYGAYMPFCFVSWGAKFFIDALLTEELGLAQLKTGEKKP